MSKRLRRLSPFCENCGSTTGLSADHIVPASERPDLVYEMANLRVLCMNCNRRRGNNCTPKERAMVEQRMANKRKRITAM
ncbi:HNH endonuclease [Mycolicibacterium smegmatis]|nr:HNH endonuclease [Mycolicibacterium smegmatis]